MEVQCKCSTSDSDRLPIGSAPSPGRVICDPAADAESAAAAVGAGTSDAPAVAGSVLAALGR